MSGAAELLTTQPIKLSQSSVSYNSVLWLVPLLEWKNRIIYSTASYLGRESIIGQHLAISITPCFFDPMRIADTTKVTHTM